MRLCLSSVTVAMLLSACAGSRVTYVAGPGMDPAITDADHRACIEESSVTRLSDNQQLLEQQCMMTRGYLMKTAP